MTPTSNLQDEFRSAWLAASGNDFASRMARKSLEASARQSPELERTLFELKHKFQAELDLHIDGSTVVHHETDAERFADFVKGIADAVKALTKESMSRARMTSGLLIAAPSPGSIRIVMRAAPPPEHDGAIQDARTETVDSNSLRTVANILARAGSMADDASVLTALVSQLPPKARSGIKRTASAAAYADWDFSGVLRRASGDDVPIAVSNREARALLDVLEAKDVETTRQTLTGRVDGQRRSIGAMWFVPTAGDSFEAAVADPELLAIVAELSASEAPATATFDVVTKVSRAGHTASKSYALVDITSTE